MRVLVTAWTAVLVALLLSVAADSTLATSHAYTKAKALVYDPTLTNFSSLLYEELLQEDPLGEKHASADPSTPSYLQHEHGDVDLLALLASMVLCVCLYM